MGHQRVQPVITVEFSVRVKDRRYQLHKCVGSRRGKPYEAYQSHVLWTSSTGRELWESSSPWVCREAAEKDLSYRVLFALNIPTHLVVDLATLAMLGEGP